MNVYFLMALIAFGLIMGISSFVLALKAKTLLEKLAAGFFACLCFGGALVCFLIVRSG